MTSQIPVCEPYLNGNERKYILDAVESGWISSSGKYLSLFEEAFAQFCGVKHGIAVCNGTVALHLALVGLGIKDGDEVIVPNFTMIASAFAVCYTRAVPVFVDADRDTWNIDPEKIEEKITAKTKAIMVVHIYGQPCEMDKISEIARKYNLKIIEDAAEVHGAVYHQKKCGALGDISAFSFFANKIATTGEGGMVLTNDDNLADLCRYYKNLCFPLHGSRNYKHDHIGFNYRMSNIHAAIGLAQTEKIADYVELRRRNNRLYREGLKGVQGVTFQAEAPETQNVYWMNAIVIEENRFGMSRDRFQSELKMKGIDTRVFFTGMNRQNSLREYGCDVSGIYPVTDALSRDGLYLPSGSALSADSIDYICATIKILANR